MNVLVIGGNRFVGKRLVSLLLKRDGTRVTLLNRGQLDDGFGNSVDRIVLDRRHLRREHPALGTERWDVVFDQVCFDAAEAAGACAAFHGRIGKLVFVSSQSVYEPGPALTEAAFDPLTHAFHVRIDRDTNYGEAKRQAEAVYSREATFPVTAVRFPIVLGEDDYTDRLKFHVDRVLAGRPIFFPNLDARISFIRSADAALFLATLAAKNIPGPVNCCAEEPVSLRRLIEMIETQTGKKARIAERPGQGDDSPFGVEADWYMATRTLTQHRFSALPIEEWMPDLIKYFVEHARSTS